MKRFDVSVRAIRGAVCAALLCVIITGCGKTVTLKPPFPETINAGAVSGAPKYSAVLMTSTATYDGTPTSMTSGFKDRLLEALRLSGAFKNVFGEDQAISENRKVKMSLTITERLEYNNLLGAIKGFIIGASFFTLSPLIPIYADYNAELRLRVEKPDGSFRQYSGFAFGESEHFFFSHGSYYADLTKQVTDTALRDLTAKLANDRAWLQR